VEKCKQLQTENIKRAEIIAALDDKIEKMRAELEIIAGRRQCIDNLMSNKDIAIAALAQTSPRKAT
jgi:hypothetical protein